MKKIGIYGGSFDPIHNGHLNVAIGMKEAHGLDEIWFCPTSSNPLKPVKSPTAAHHRLAMVNLAIEGESGFRIIDIELKMHDPAYTVDTLHALRKVYSKDLYAFYLIIGEDSARDFHRWRDPDEIISLAHLLVSRRLGFNDPPEGFAGSSKVVSAIEAGLTELPQMDISSTEVRQRIRNGLYCGHLVPRKVLDYISIHHLYL